MRHGHDHSMGDDDMHGHLDEPNLLELANRLDRLGRSDRASAPADLESRLLTVVRSGETAPAPAPLRFERRSEDRWPLTGVAEAHRLGGDRFGQVAVLRLVDCSEECLGATCDEPLEPGAVVSLAFRTPGRPVRNGVVVRCLPCGEGYRVAVRFDRRLAA